MSSVLILLHKIFFNLNFVNLLQVILKLKMACSHMSEEDIAKMGVALLNCQSESEGRNTFLCTHDMVKYCTQHNTFKIFLGVYGR